MIGTLKTPLTKLGGYTLERRIASGGMAEVYLAKREGPHGFSKRVALKCILPQLASDPDFVSMFIDEAKIAAQLEHPGIVSVFDFGEQEGALYLAMEFVDGPSVGKILRTLAQRKETMPLSAALHIGTQAARALGFAHRAVSIEGLPLQVIHRDVSPANLLVSKSGRVKLTDFGIARCATTARRTEDGQVRGKVGYMSPEQVTAKNVSHKSDVFALATVVAELLLGVPLFGKGEDLDVLMRIRNVDLSVLYAPDRSLPVDIRQTLAWALDRDAEARPSADAFADALLEVAGKRDADLDGERELARVLQRLDLVENNTGVREIGKAMARPTTHVLIDVDVSLAEDDKVALVKLAKDDSNETALLEEPTDGRHAPFGHASLDGVSVEQLRDAAHQQAKSIEAMQANHRGAAMQAQFEAPEYYLLNDRGLAEGPLPYAEIVRKIVRGEVTPKTKIRKDDAEFQAGAQLLELQRYLTSPALMWEAGETEQSTLRGDIEVGTLLRVVHGLTSQRSTGVLHLWDGIRKKKVYFVDGKPDFVSSTESHELFGEFLVRKNMCLRMEVDMALALLPRYSGKLGEALMDLGVLSERELLRGIAMQVRERYLEAFRWRHGEYAFRHGLRSLEESYAFTHSGAAELLRDAILECDLDEAEDALFEVKHRPLQAASAPPMPLRAFAPPTTWEHVISKVNGKTSVSDIVTEATWENGSKGASHAWRALYFAYGCGLVEVVRPVFVPLP